MALYTCTSSGVASTAYPLPAVVVGALMKGGGAYVVKPARGRTERWLLASLISAEGSLFAQY